MLPVFNSLCPSSHVLVGARSTTPDVVYAWSAVPQVCPTSGAALGVLWIIGRQSLGLCISPFLAEILEGSCIHFHLYFV